MKHALSMIALSVALAAACGSSRLALAAEEMAAAPVTAFGAGARRVDVAVLEEQRGGTDVHEVELSKIWANGSVSEVQAHDLATGQNVISGGAFANASGSMLNVQNSGNGVLIQNAMILNVDVY